MVHAVARSRARLAAVLAGIFFAIGYFIVAVVPGGGDVTAKEFHDFYDSSGKRDVALLLAIALTAGCLLMIWFFTELRARLPETPGAQVAHILAIVGATLVLAGGGVLGGPMGVQQNSGGKFVGVTMAHTFAQAGLGVMLGGGMMAFAVALILVGVTARRSGALTRWASTAAIVCGVITFGSYVWAPGLVFPLWVIAVGIGGLADTVPETSVAGVVPQTAAQPV